MSEVLLQFPGLPAHALEAGVEATVGRSTSNTICLGDISISRHHARFTLEGDRVFVEDLGSRNGVKVNGKPVTGRQVVQPGDAILVGSVPVAMRRSAAPDHPSVFIGSAEGLLPTQHFQRAAHKLYGPQGSTAGDLLSQALRLIQELSLELVREKTAERLLEHVAERLLAFLRADRGVVLLREADEEPRPVVVRGRTRVASEVHLSHTVVQAVLDQGEALLLRDGSERLMNAQSLVGSGVATAIVVPLEAEARIIGLLYFDAGPLRGSFSEDELRVAATVAHLAAAKIQNGRLIAEVQEQRLLARDMEIAHTLQRKILALKVPHTPVLDLHAELRPAKEVGGDLYDAFLKDDHLHFCIGDVSGKGVPAALVMALTKALFRTHAEVLGDPAAVLGAMNVRLCEETVDQMFVTVFCGELDLATGALRYANAGHDRPLVLRPGEPAAVLEARSGLVLGALPRYEYQTQCWNLRPGDGLVLYTDGITEAMDPEHTLFGVARLRHTLDEASEEPPAGLGRRIIAAVDAFASGAPQADDLTLLILRYLGGTP